MSEWLHSAVAVDSSINRTSMARFAEDVSQKSGGENIFRKSSVAQVKRRAKGSTGGQCTSTIDAQTSIPYNSYRYHSRIVTPSVKNVRSDTHSSSERHTISTTTRFGFVCLTFLMLWWSGTRLMGEHTTSSAEARLELPTQATAMSSADRVSLAIVNPQNLPGAQGQQSAVVDSRNSDNDSK